MSNMSKARVTEVNRDQYILRPIDIERLVDENHPVRGIWAFVGRLDLASFYEAIGSVEGQAGRSAWDPRLLISIWIYAYSRGIGSAREISRLLEFDPAFQWLTAMETINHHTLSDFRMSGKSLLDQLFQEVLCVLCADGLITLERVTHDGTKVQANAGRDTFRREDKIKELLKVAEEHVAAMGDPRTEDVSNQRRKARERASRERKEKLEHSLKELKKLRESRKAKQSKEETRASITDPQARNMKQSDGGFAPSYNVQISTDSEYGIVVGAVATQSATDCRELIPALEEIKKNCDVHPEQVVVDGGFTSNENIIECSERNIDFIGSSGAKRGESVTNRMSKQGIQKDFYPDKFIFDDAANEFICPAGKRLSEKSAKKHIGSVTHNYEASSADCITCRFKQLCCPNSKKGRALTMTVDDAIVREFKAKMETDEAKKAYKTRGPVAEFTNAWIKSKTKLRQFCVRGLDKVNQEIKWACMALNISYWMRITSVA